MRSDVDWISKELNLSLNPLLPPVPGVFKVDLYGATADIGLCVFTDI